MTDDKILSYTAGLFDGEGCISTTNAGSTKLILDIASTNREVMDFLLLHFGGAAYDKKYIYRKTQRRQIWRWRLNGIAAQDFLRLIHPFLIIKKRQVEVAIAFPVLGGKEIQPVREVFRKLLSDMKSDDVVLVEEA